MGDETLEDEISVAAPFILAVVFAFHFFPWYFGRSFKFGNRFSCRPSTFAQAAKLRRLAASMEEELMKRYQGFTTEAPFHYKGILRTSNAEKEDSLLPSD